MKGPVARIVLAATALLAACEQAPLDLKRPEAVTRRMAVAYNDSRPICALTDSTRYTGRATILNNVGGAAMSMLNDGRGVYADGVDGTNVESKGALALWSGYSSARKPRAVRFDLSRPVPGSGALNRGIITDNEGNIHFHWRFETIDTVKWLHAPTEMPVGTAHSSDRTGVAIHTTIKGQRKHYLMLFGPVTRGACQGADPLMIPDGGAGTTPVTMLRTSNTTWQAFTRSGAAGETSAVGHLWDITGYQNGAVPQDLGLYYFDFNTEFTISGAPAAP